VQATQVLALPPEKVPAEQTPQPAADVSPNAVEYVPAPQLWHAEELMAPDPVAKVPAAHVEHAETPLPVP